MMGQAASKSLGMLMSFATMLKCAGKEDFKPGIVITKIRVNLILCRCGKNKN